MAAIWDEFKAPRFAPAILVDGSGARAPWLGRKKYRLRTLSYVQKQCQAYSCDIPVIYQFCIDRCGCIDNPSCLKGCRLCMKRGPRKVNSTRLFSCWLTLRCTFCISVRIFLTYHCRVE